MISLLIVCTLGARLRDARGEATTPAQADATRATCDATAKAMNAEIGGGVVTTPKVTVGLTSLACPRPEFDGGVQVNCTNDGVAHVTEQCKWRKWNEILMDNETTHEMISGDMLKKMRDLFELHVQKGENARSHARRTAEEVDEKCKKIKGNVEGFYATRNKYTKKLKDDDQNCLNLDGKAEQISKLLKKWKDGAEIIQWKIEKHEQDIEAEQNLTSPNQTKIAFEQNLVATLTAQKEGIQSNGYDSTVLSGATNDWDQLGCTYQYAKDFNTLKTTTTNLEVELAVYQSCMGVSGKMAAFYAHVDLEVQRTTAIREKLKSMLREHRAASE